MSREVTHFVCQSCGGEFPKWSGQCANCNAWNSLVETVTTKPTKGLGGARRASGVKPMRLAEVATGELAGQRRPSGIGELDRVLGGGMVPGSVMLLAGEPGIGKSTLLTQLALKAANSTWHRANGEEKKKPSTMRHTPSTVLYVCGEESPEQIKLRVDRLAAATKAGSNNKKTDSLAANLLLLPETDVDAIVETIEQLTGNPSAPLRAGKQPFGSAQGGQTTLGLVIVDSIQTMQTGDLSGMAGSVGQIRESAFRLINMAKKSGVPLFIVGHVTKEGSIAGPKVLEHMVDVVLELTGDNTHEFRILRGLKNRFGAIDEVGVFTLTDSGMEGVANPSDVFLGRRRAVAGSAVVVTMAGLRPVLTEVQALVTPTTLAVPRRVSTGVDQRRVVLLAAVLTRHCGLRLNESDIFVRVSGGLTLAEPAGDLGVALAIASATLGKALPPRAAAMGEVGLLGEIRPVGRMKQRESEAKRQGYSQIISAERHETLAGLVRKLLR